MHVRLFFYFSALYLSMSLGRPSRMSIRLRIRSPTNGKKTKRGALLRNAENATSPNSKMLTIKSALPAIRIILFAVVVEVVISYLNSTRRYLRHNLIDVCNFLYCVALCYVHRWKWAELFHCLVYHCVACLLLSRFSRNESYTIVCLPFFASIVSTMSKYCTKLSTAVCLSASGHPLSLTATGSVIGIVLISKGCSLPAYIATGSLVTVAGFQSL